MLQKQPMDIQSYLDKHHLTYAQFGARLGVSGGMVGHWLSGRHRITGERAAQIEMETEREVTRLDLRPDIFAGQTEAA